MVLPRPLLAILPLIACIWSSDLRAEPGLPLLSDRLGRAALVQVHGAPEDWLNRIARLDGGRHLRLVPATAPRADLRLVVIHSWEQLDESSVMAQAVALRRRQGQEPLSLRAAEARADGSTRHLTVISRSAALAVSHGCLPRLILYRLMVDADLTEATPAAQCATAARAVDGIYELAAERRG